jgi:hypothetical protein
LQLPVAVGAADDVRLAVEDSLVEVALEDSLLDELEELLVLVSEEVVVDVGYPVGSVDEGLVVG